MAFLFKFSSEMGIDFPEAYGRVVRIEGDQEKMVATMHIFASQSARDNGKQPLSFPTIAYAPNLADGSPNLFRQAYDRFRQESAFEAAVEI
ncbi:hypothetical protein [uncultured Sphingomonas sp.]|uniref:hypothetical protein n=1 Tax=uncultured Sphingomonas sp. TaxID=158754 RepID=UPI0025DEAA81|nr:hypothetical protein [uncultured Sphingomonas sp.]